MKQLRMALPAFVLLLTACSAPAPVQGSPTAEAAVPVADLLSVTAPGAVPAASYGLTTASGARITFTLPTPVVDPAVAAIDAYRAKVGAAPVSYLVADVDNRAGTAPVNLYTVNAFSEEGRQSTFTSVADALHSWAPTFSYDFGWSMNGKSLDEEQGAALKCEANNLYNADIADVDTAERTTVILASPDAELPTEFTRVAVQPSVTGGEEEAHPLR
ncbi:hypothetical protein M8J71_08275 [Pseudarthrobacter sp. R1]|uniref:hypothetical protein n=1 Tax=Pseudarthrobacter sp. R1 TaxID=2944934 RepID=UPI00210DE54B|nr:hypothetical protein [Pseudarthrobacter sp. R1]MCQ6270477.1 hypothetical protein [Pseudarthrobacter sp. R1]